MQILSRCPLLLLVCPVLLFSSTKTEQRPAFKPADGAEWERTYRESTSWNLEDAAIEVGGGSMTVDPPEASAEMVRQVQTGSRVELGQGAVVKRDVRDLDRIEGNLSIELIANGEEGVFGTELVSPLADETVQFLRDGADGTYTVSFADDEDRDPAPLEGLDFRADYQGLLPSEDVEVGDQWSVSDSATWTLFSPGGALGLLPAQDTRGGQDLPTGALVGASLVSLSEASPGAFEGDVEITLEEWKQGEDGPLAVLKIETEGTLSLDLSDRYSVALEEVGSSNEFAVLEIEMDLEGEGRLLWDLSDGLPSSLQMETEFSAELTMAWREDFGDGQLTDLKIELEIAGITEQTYLRE